MTRASQLRALAERVQALTGPCERADAAILYDGLGVMQNHRGPRYTASIDDAMTLIPAGWFMILSDWQAPLLRERGAWQVVLTLDRDVFKLSMGARCDHGATPALALTAAALLAMAAPEQDT